jgi:hypothetical protein
MLRQLELSEKAALRTEAAFLRFALSAVRELKSVLDELQRSRPVQVRANAGRPFTCPARRG